MKDTKKTGGHPTTVELTAYLNDELGDKDEEMIREHINGCDRCRDRFLKLIQSNVRKRKGVIQDDDSCSFWSGAGLLDPVG